MNPNISEAVRRSFPGLWRSSSIAVLGFALGVPLVATVRAVDVVTPTVPGTMNATNVVNQPLPPAGNDMPDDQPSLAHVWIPGHWHWAEGAYAWVAGHWEVPPIPNATWVAPQWVPQSNGYVLREGMWQPSAPPQAAAAPAEISSLQPPPPLRVDNIPERPSAAHVWQPGYWDFRDNQFRWEQGRWEVPPRQDLVWVPAHWESRGDRFVLVSGYWRENPPVVATPPPQPVVMAAPAAAPQVVVVAPPPPRAEVVYGHPLPGHVWVPGYWAWHGGRYVWIAGHWERPPHGHRSWIAPRWEQRGGSYVFIEGHWR